MARRSDSIRHASFKHGWFYHYRVHLSKLENVPETFSSLTEFLVDMFENCPHEHFQDGPRSSHMRLELAHDVSHERDHVICSMARLSHEVSEYKTAHSRVQVTMLKQDAVSLAVEVPVWALPDELDFLDHDLPLTGHIDVLSVTDKYVWVWDYKPGASKEKYAHVQTLLYALMLSLRTGIPIERFKCGYFDESDCFTFRPQELLAQLRR